MGKKSEKEKRRERNSWLFLESIEQTYSVLAELYKLVCAQFQKP